MARSPRGTGGLLASLCVCQALAGVAQAADSSEFWPEVSGFVALSPRTRLFLNAAYAQAKESDDKSLDLAAYLDISLKPILRQYLLAEDWQATQIATPTNLAFCGNDRRTLVLASLSRWHLACTRMEIPGLPLQYPSLA